MKKSLIAAALLGALAFQAQAEVTIYGVADASITYQYLKTPGHGSTNTVSMDSGTDRGSRVGIHATEKLTDRTQVEVILEDQFALDSGVQQQDDKHLFHREATLNLNTDYGRFGFGRMGTSMSQISSWCVVGPQISAIGPGYGPYSGTSVWFTSGQSQMDNTIAWRSPRFAGFALTAQYSGNVDQTVAGSVENKASAERYASLTGEFKRGALTLLAAVDSHLWASSVAGNPDNSLQFTVGGNYDFGPARLFLAGNYFDHMKLALAAGNPSWYIASGFDDFGLDKAMNYYAKGYGVSAGVSVPLSYGKIGFNATYNKVKDVETANGTAVSGNPEFERAAGTVTYEYPFSKRTTFYVSAGYGEQKMDRATNGGTVKFARALFGIDHNF